MTVAWQKEFTVPPDDRDGVAGLKVEDGGQAMVMYEPLASMYQRAGGELYDPAFFVRFHSWTETRPYFKQHTLSRA